MIVLLVFVGIILILSLILFLLCISTLQVEIKKLEIDTTNKKGNKIEDYIVNIKIKVLGKITLLKITINKEIMKKYRLINEKVLMKIRDVEKELMDPRKESLVRNNLKYIRQLDIQVDKVDLYLKIGLIDAFYTAILVGVISTVISIIVSKNTKNYKCNKYSIIPEYDSELAIKLNLNCIIKIKMIHIINVIYMLMKEKRSEGYDERKSNRRTYVCSND